MVTIAFAVELPADATAIAVAAVAGKPGAGADRVAALIDRPLARLIERHRFEGKARDTLALTTDHDQIAHVFLYGGTGEDDIPRRGPDAALDLGAGLANAANGRRVVDLVVLVDAGPDAVAQAVAMAEGAALSSYRFDRYRTKEGEDKKPTLKSVTFVLDDAVAAGAAFAPRKAVVEAVFRARDLVSEPANVLTPPEFAERCRDLASLGIEVEILDDAALEAGGFGSLLAVNWGSVHPARVVIMRYNGLGDAGADEAPIAIVGKGVCFDTGGISIKPAAGMEDMKWDMGGAAATVGAMAAIAGRKAKVKAVGIIGLVENMPSGSAMRPGDVITSKSGQTIEVINTDAEGRLVLADILWHVQEADKPRAIVDFATLTGAMIIALGDVQAGVMANDDTLADQLFAAGTDSGDRIWRLPLDPEYDKQLDSQIADMKNVGGRPGGSITAAMFLQRFIKDGTPWAHVDIAGVTWLTKDKPTAPKGASGFGVRLIDQWVQSLEQG